MTPHPTPDRRAFLQASAAAGLTLAVGGPSRANPVPSGRAKSCIVLMLTGGPSQLDTWDPKSDAPSEVRSPFAAIPTRVPGVRVTELFPKLAAVMDKVSLVRTLHHEYAPIHENGFQLLNTGRRFGDGPAWPSVGAVVAHLKREAGERMLAPVVVPTLDVCTGVNVSHGQGAAHLDCNTAVWEGHVGDRWAKTDAPISRFGHTVFGQNCGWAAMTHRVTAKLGHGSFVTVNAYPTVFDAVSWDCHADGGALGTTLGDYKDAVAPDFDTAFTGILHYLEERGRLDETLVVAVGEFGRTPKRNANGGRDHWPGCWTALVAGGGVQGGRVIGTSDRTGSEPADRPVTCPELVATIYHALGIPPTTLIPGPDGTPAPVVEAEPIRELF